jgi:hypothetical protein
MPKSSSANGFAAPDRRTVANDEDGRDDGPIHTLD